jgi:hypothetical protein
VNIAARIAKNVNKFPALIYFNKYVPIALPTKKL